ncbi:MAG: hypothetical protein ABIG99_01980 [Patescibacteria group bacterium]
MKKNNKMSTGKIAAVGAGLAAAGAGAYYLLGPNAKLHQKKIKTLLTKMQKEVTKEIKKVKEVTPPLYHKAVDIVSKNYAKQYKLHEKDIKAFAQKIKGEWSSTVKKAKKAVRTSKNKNK